MRYRKLDTGNWILDNFKRLFGAVLMLCACLFSSIAIAKDLKTIDTNRNGWQEVYGLVSPLDQVGKHFYLRNEDGLVEIKLADNAQVGILFRENKNHEILAQN